MFDSFNDLFNKCCKLFILRFEKRASLVQSRRLYRRHLYLLAWLNISIQLLLPVCLSFTPLIAAASARQSQDVIASEPYVLGLNETVFTVARQHGLTLDQLKKLNQFRTFAKPFTELAVGDEIDIPLTTPGLTQNAAFGTLSATPPAAAAAPRLRGSDHKPSWNEQLSRSALPGAHTEGPASGMARSAVSGEVSQAAQQWLGQFGTARLQLNVDDNFHLDGSALDLLIPLYDQPKDLLFTQLGARNKDGRNTVNLGAGVRSWQGDWMLGMNAFYDDDITGNNRRMGMGFEAWRDYLKLSANNYFRLSDWHQSRDLDDYNERPANGYDIRAEAFLPAYPQLGGKLTFEQYRGDKVALFGKDNLQKDPYAVTLGLNYTPVSLVTIGADHREGKGNASDTRLNIQMNYRFGDAWQTQIDPASVASMRTLAGTRYDLVDRNNDIVLEYQKQQVIHLRLPAEVNGSEREQATVVAQVTSKYGLDRIDWDTAALAAAGGGITQIGQNTLAITLPPYQRAGAASNIYDLSAVAHDIKQNASNRATTRIEVLPAAAEITAANLTVTKDGSVANGSAANAVRAVVTDAGGNPVAGQTVIFTAANGASITTVIGTSGADGVVTATLTNTLAGVSAVTASLNSSRQTVNTTFIADSGTAQIADGNLTVTKNNAVANGHDNNAVQAKVTDAHGNPLAGQTVTFTAANGAVLAHATVVTGADGSAEVILTNTRTGISTVTATLGNAGDRSVDTTFIGDIATARIAAGDLTVLRDNAAADGTQTNAVRAKVTDAQGNPLAGQTVTFKATNGATLAVIQVVTDAHGIAETTLTNTVAGISNITASLTNGNNQSVDIRFVADNVTARIADGDLMVTKNDALADGHDANRVQARITDAQGNPLPDQTVTFIAGNGASLSATTVVTGVDGIAAVTLTNTLAGTSAVTASLSNGNHRTVDTRFIANAATARIISITVTKDGALANATDANAVRAQVVDAHGNPLTGLTVTFSATNGASLAQTTVATVTGGFADVTLTSTTAGASTVTAGLTNGSSQAVDAHFIADGNTARIVNLTVTENGAVANGTSANGVRAVVVDAHGNPLVDQTVVFSVTNGAILAHTSVTTVAGGFADVTLTNTAAGASTVAASLANGSSQTADVEFVADGNTAHVISLVATTNNVLANGTDTNVVEARIVDAHGNPLANQAVAFSATNGAALVNATVVTGTNGLANATLTNTAAGASVVTASLANGSSRTVDTYFIADSNTAHISILTVTKDNSVANGADANEARALVVDGQGNPLTGQTVAFSAANGAILAHATVVTDANGIADNAFTNTVAGTSAVTASLGNGSSRTENSQFIANAATAHIVSLSVTHNDAAANGSASNGVRAEVADAHGNPLTNLAVSFSATNGATLSNAMVNTTPGGLADATLTNTVAGTSAVTASLANGSSQMAFTNFVADSNTAHISILTVTRDNAAANGTDANGVRALVMDANGNPLTGQVVTFSAANGATLAHTTVTTGVDGLADDTLTNTAAGVSAVTASLGSGSNQMVNTTFIADSATARIISLTVTNDGAAANGTSTNGARALVVDAHGNPLAGIEITSSATNGATLTQTMVTTGAGGLADITLANTAAGISAVTASLSNGSTQTAYVNFVADANTARIVSLTVVQDGSAANGSDANEVRVIITDAHNNPLTGINVTFSATNGATLAQGSVVTGPGGIADNGLTSTLAGDSMVTASLGNGQSEMKTTHFIADAATARIVSLTVTRDGSLANGSDANTVRAVVADAHNNLLIGVNVNFNATNGATLSQGSVVTGTDGIVDNSLTNTLAGDSVITASLATGSIQTASVSFNADPSTARLATLTVTHDGSAANGSDANTVQAVVTDAHNNPLIGINVTFSATNGAALALGSVTTGAGGVADNSLTNTVAGTSAVTATLGNGATLTENTTFIPDSAGAEILEANLTVTTNNSPADGTTPNTVRAVVTDAFGQPMPGQAVTFTANNGASVLVAQVTTNANGEAIANLVSSTAGGSLVTATLDNGKFRQVGVVFAQNIFITAINLLEDNATANGIEANVVEIHVVNAHGQPAANVAISLTADNSAGTFRVISPPDARTNAQGIINLQYTYTRLGSLTVTASDAAGATLSGPGGQFTIPSISVQAVVDFAAANGTDRASAIPTVTTARGQPAVNTRLTVSIMRSQAGQLFAFPATPITAIVTTDGQGQAFAEAVSSTPGFNLFFIFSMPDVNEDGTGTMNSTGSNQEIEFY